MSHTHFSSASVEWATPRSLFDALNAEFHFTLDVCATPENAKLPLFFTREMDGLAQDWRGHVCWMNPPYGRAIGAWVEKAATCGARAVALLPARTDTRWWHEHIWDEEHHRPRPGVQVRLLRGRLKLGGATTGAPFPSAVVVFDPWSKACTHS